MTVPGLPVTLRGRLHERARWEWRAADGGDPLAAIEGFLAAEGLDLRDLTRPAGPGTGAPVGAALLLGAQAGPPETRMSARPSPCAGVPDAAVVVYGRAPYARRESTGPGELGPWQGSWTPEEHAAAVMSVRDAIGRGDVYQANVVGHRSAAFSGDPAAVGRALSGVPDAPYAGSLAGEGWAVHSASPELFLSVRGGLARTRPIKGTAPRGVGPADLAGRRALRASAKDRAEHVMIVDLERNDLARVARTGGVRVDELYAVRPLAGVWHAESTVTADLRDGVGLAELLGATFPGGSVTGAPKLAALAEIARLEAVGRGPSMGALGWVGADGSVLLGLTIRTVAVADGRCHLWAGGGITWGSDPAGEVAEADAKAAPLLAALGVLAADAQSGTA